VPCTLSSKLHKHSYDYQEEGNRIEREKGEMRGRDGRERENIKKIELPCCLIYNRTTHKNREGGGRERE
jgi:hypothetical protein